MSLTPIRTKKNNSNMKMHINLNSPFLNVITIILSLYILVGNAFCIQVHRSCSLLGTVLEKRSVKMTHSVPTLMKVLVISGFLSLQDPSLIVLFLLYYYSYIRWFLLQFNNSSLFRASSLFEIRRFLAQSS